jgi:hypothetical protein
MAKKATATEAEIEIVSISQNSVTIAVIGESPLILNRLSEKAKHELLMPSGRKNAAAKAISLKHDPMAEFQAAAHRLPGGPTLLAVPSTAIKGAMRTAALDLPGASKAQIGRLVYLPSEYTPVYGTPMLKCDVVRSADIGRTPDIRTRVVIPQWAAMVTVTFTTPMIKERAVVNLLAAAGVTSGVGDWRPEKGSGAFGRFTLTNVTDPKFAQILATGGRDAQVEAMAAAEPYDDETRDLLAWFSAEFIKRGYRAA